MIMGGAAGTVSRYLLSEAVHERTGEGFPFGTLAVNILGCLIVGILSVMNEGTLLMDENIKMLLATGFCGAFTTFSTLILESSHLAKGGESFRALFYIVLSLLAGFAAFIAGNRLGRLV